MDRRAWWATVHRVPKSWNTQMKQLSTHARTQRRNLPFLWPLVPLKGGRSYKPSPGSSVLVAVGLLLLAGESVDSCGVCMCTYM